MGSYGVWKSMELLFFYIRDSVYCHFVKINEKKSLRKYVVLLNIVLEPLMNKKLQITAFIQIRNIF